MATGTIAGNKVVETSYLNGSIIQYVNGHNVEISIGGAFTAPTGETTVLTTLTDHKPRRGVYAVCSVQGGQSNKFCLVSIAANGQIIAYNYSGLAGSYLFGTVTYIT